MKYITLIVIALIISFVAVAVFGITINRKMKFSENIKYTAITLLISLPIMILIGGSLFLSFRIVASLLNVEISNFQIFFVSILGVYAIFISDFIGKNILLAIVSRLLALKYKNKDLNENEMLDIANKSQGIYRMLLLIVMFFIGIVLYQIIFNSISIDVNNMFLSITAIINVLIYVMFFRVSFRGATK